MNAVLIVEDQPSTREQLRELLRETVCADIQLFVAATIDDAIRQTEMIWELRPSTVVAIVDVMIPQRVGAVPIVAESAVKALAAKTNPQPLIIFVSAFEQSKDIETWRSRYTAAPGSADSYFVSKNDVEWGVEVVKIVREGIYCPPIESLMDSLFGRESVPGNVQRVGDLRFVEANHHLEVLTARISAHYEYLRPDLKERVDRHFDVVRAGKKMTAELL